MRTLLDDFCEIVLYLHLSYGNVNLSLVYFMFIGI